MATISADEVPSSPGRMDEPDPVVSVVLPAGDDARMLSETLRSLADQWAIPCEVLIVTTPEHPHAAMESDLGEQAKVSVVSSTESGIGAAMGAGLQRSTGRYVLLVQPGCVVPAGGLVELVATLDRTGSDLATGQVARVTSGHAWRSTTSPPAFDFQIDGTHLRATPQLVFDTSLSNKLVRRDLLERLDFRFDPSLPDAGSVEAIRLLADAATVDIVPRVTVELPRTEPDPTAGRIPLPSGESMLDRLEALERIEAEITERGLVDARRELLRRVAEEDLLDTVAVLAADGEGSTETRWSSTLLDGYRRLLRRWRIADFDVITGAWAPAIAEVVRSGDTARVLRIARLRANDATPADFGAALTDDPRLMTRYATERLSASARQAAQRARQVVTASKRRLRPSIVRLGERAADGPLSSPVLARLAHLPGRSKPKARGVSAPSGLPSATEWADTPDPGSELRAHPAGNLRAWSGAGRRSPTTTVTPMELDDEWLTVAAAEGRSGAPLRLRSTQSGRLVPGEPLERGRWRFSLRPVRAGNEPSWRLEVATDGSWSEAGGPLAVSRLVRWNPYGQTIAQVTANGHVVLRHRHVLPVVATVDHNLRIRVGERIHLRQVRLRHVDLLIDLPALRTDGCWEIDPAAATRFGLPVPLRLGTWRAEGLVDGSWRTLVSLPDEALPNHGRGEPVRAHLDDRPGRTRLEVALSEDSITVHSGTLFTDEERGPWNQTVLAAAAARAATDRPLQRAVLYECFEGQAVAGHPKAVFHTLRHDLPGWDHYWVTSPGATYAPEGATPLVRRSREYFERLGDARILVANAALPKHFRRRDGQVVLQTWHGTPLKRLRLDMITFEHVRAGYAADSAVEAEQWTHLISPSPYCSRIFPRAFAFSNELLEIGAPGNDRLIDPDPDEVVAIRERLGLAAHQRAVLFAPTWRDDQRTATGATAELGFDPERLLASLDRDTVVLFRAHNMVSAIRGLRANDRFVNVTDYPDIGDLYLVADALCTDYSSVMFDYACLGRPMAFYCTDLDHYRDELRGFYFDFAARAPGPIITDERHLGPQLSRLLNDGLGDDERVRFDAFARLFVPLDDGGASRRAADAIIEAIG